MPGGYTGIGKITKAGNSTVNLMFHCLKHAENIERNLTRIIGNNTETLPETYETFHESLPEILLFTPPLAT